MLRRVEPRYLRHCRSAYADVRVAQCAFGIRLHGQVTNAPSSDLGMRAVDKLQRHLIEQVHVSTNQFRRAGVSWRAICKRIGQHSRGWRVTASKAMSRNCLSSSPASSRTICRASRCLEKRASMAAVRRVLISPETTRFRRSSSRFCSRSVSTFCATRGSGVPCSILPVEPIQLVQVARQQHSGQQGQHTFTIRDASVDFRRWQNRQ